MKAWEALQILESLPADTEVNLTIGQKVDLMPGSLPKWAQMPQPKWVAGPTYTPNNITCKTVH